MVTTVSYRIIFLDNPVNAPYIRSFSLHDLTMGTQRLSSSSFITIHAVSMARESQLVYTTSTCNSVDGDKDGREGVEGIGVEGEGEEKMRKGR